jgi:S-adenosylmethionine:tRNA ribosyltransferase-isomerase
MTESGPSNERRMDGGFEATLLGRWPEVDGPLFRLRFSGDRKSTRLNSSHQCGKPLSRMPSSA